MSFTLQIGSRAPDFNLPATDGRNYKLSDLAESRLLVVVFSCNHCPYVIGSEDRMIRFCQEYVPRGVTMVAINSNETENHPTDSFEHMVRRAGEKKFPFTYLRDATQDVAMAYGALRTPHFFVFDYDRLLCYTGRMDDNPKNAALATTHELRDAVDALLAGRTPAVAVTNPLGCNVKWAGRPEKWIPPDACDLV
jgi:peroxiredoxin